MKYLLLLSLLLISSNKEVEFIKANINTQQRIAEHNKLIDEINKELKYISSADGLPTAKRRRLYKRVSEIHQEWADSFKELSELE